MKPRYALKPPEDWEVCRGKDINPWLLVACIIALSIAAGVAGASLAKVFS